MAPPKRAKRNTGPLSSDRILTSSSPILKKDIHGFLVTCISGWSTNYTEDEKRAIIASLPPSYRIYNTCSSTGTLLCPITLEFVHSDPWLKAAVGKFKRDVAEGYYERSWQTKARQAMSERQEGKFETYLQEHTEELFGKAAQNETESSQQESMSSESDWRKGQSSRRRKVVGKMTFSGTSGEVGRDGKVQQPGKIVTTRSGRRSRRTLDLEDGRGF